MSKEVIRVIVEGADVIDIHLLKEFQGELKTLSDEAYEQLKDDILTLGFADPINVWPDPESKNNYILDGHQRLKTLSKMRDEGYEIPLIPVVWVRAETFKQAKKLVLSLTSQFGQMTTDGLKEFIRGAEIDAREVASSFRFPEIDMKAFVKDMYPSDEDEKDPDEIPAVPRVAKSKRGELYILGDHKLLCGDATLSEDVKKLMGKDMADLVITDPPYNVDYIGKTSESLKIENDKMSNTEFRKFLFDVFNRYLEVSHPGAGMYVFHADSEGENFRGAMRESGWPCKQCCIWVKNSMVMGRQDYQWKHEPVLVSWKPGASHNWYSDRKQTTIWEFDKPSRSPDHPTTKPIDLICYPMENSSKEGDIVIDFFGGSGSTLIAAQKLQRKCRSMELSPVYVDVILNRWAEYTGANPVRLNDDGTETPWSDIKKE